MRQGKQTKLLLALAPRRPRAQSCAFWVCGAWYVVIADGSSASKFESVLCPAVPGRRGSPRVFDVGEGESEESTARIGLAGADVGEGARDLRKRRGRIGNSGIGPDIEILEPVHWLAVAGSFYGHVARSRCAQRFHEVILRLVK